MNLSHDCHNDTFCRILFSIILPTDCVKQFVKGHGRPNSGLFFNTPGPYLWDKFKTLLSLQIASKLFQEPSVFLIAFTLLRFLLLHEALGFLHFLYYSSVMQLRYNNV